MTKIPKKTNQILKNKIFPSTLKLKLDERLSNGSFRELTIKNADLVDFSSNDYLGFASNENIEKLATSKINDYKDLKFGATGSRLLSGNFPLIEDFENYLADFYQVESATTLNSGYDANLGLISAIGQRQDLILYDALCHASIRDGIGLSKAKSFKFPHKDFENLKAKLAKFQSEFKTIYVITEQVFSMDGDQTDVKEITEICNDFGAYLILDEAHAVGTISQTNVENSNYNIFARVLTFGKSFGAHGAVIFGSSELKDYLINFAKSFIYTTAPSSRNIAHNWAAHLLLKDSIDEFEQLQFNIAYFKEISSKFNLENCFIESYSAIQSCVIGGNNQVKNISKQLEMKGFDVRPILSPTVPNGEERLRFCLHSFNTKNEIYSVLENLSKLLL
ncbi:aminotransferase class I/II-fold pyridoxal phosphate-dependent enzyme [Psychroflexus aestuariivivens]|uniref:aminotransferase class I/II-fold pyridoxal phosphate-dependent enzyme n=1 Tax=Psychroflexus aestuariivivens TaxID=1795040 RepID=UPI000FDA8EFE|nr:pyridoxal phosphate-dependent aminotransferase family protein [Psychroflexus aestuariivivens]